jgi:prolyl oligopeptidase
MQCSAREPTPSFTTAGARQPHQKNPLIIRIDRKAGHGAGKPLAKVLEAKADVYGFIAHTVGAVWHD